MLQEGKHFVSRKRFVAENVLFQESFKEESFCGRKRFASRNIV